MSSSVSKDEEVVIYTGPWASYPLVVSHPRSGSHWINNVVEHYVGKRRGMLVAGGSVTSGFSLNLDIPDDGDYAFLHTHDLMLTLAHPPEKTLYLYRDPPAVIYSMFKVGEKSGIGRDPTKLDGLFTRQCVRLREHLERYLLGPQKAAQHIRYEAFEKNPLPEFYKLCKLLNVFYDEDKVQKSLATASKAKLAQQAQNSNVMENFFNFEMDTPAYAAGRMAFIAEHGDFINSLVISEELAPFFTPVV